LLFILKFTDENNKEVVTHAQRLSALVCDLSDNEDVIEKILEEDD